MVIGRLFRGTGASVEEVMEQYDLTRAQVHAVLAHYSDHKDDIDRHLEHEDQINNQHIPPLSGLLAKRQKAD